jgi:hypothetical protein
MICLAKAVIVVGLAAVSVYAYLRSNGQVGSGWAFLAVLVLIFY